MPEMFLFVSHVSEDRAAAKEIVDELERRGVRCWIAPRDVRPGRPYDDEIANAIEASRAMLLIFSEHCNASDYIRREVTVAGESHKVVIPFRIENAQPKHGLRVRLSDLHWLDGFASREKAIDELVKTFPAEKVDTVPEAASEQVLQERVSPVVAKVGSDEVRERTERLGREAQVKRRADEEERHRLPRSEARPMWPPSRPVLVAASLIGLTVLGAVVLWLVRAPATPVPQPTSIAPGQAPAAPTQMAVTALSPERERALKPHDTFKECSNCPEMVVVPPGTFTMGSPASELNRASDEGPQHPVTFAQSFAVGRFELTFEEWDACVADGGCRGYKPDSQGWGRGRRPVINVSWDDAKAYIAWLAKKTGKTYRLLSEAEREYVTRAGTTTPFWWGNSISTSQANYDGTPYGSGAKGEYRGRTVAVDSFEPNAWGLYQVHGNVYEWTEDCGNDSYQGAPADGSARTGGDCGSRVIRGGSWDYDAEYLRSASRLAYATDTRDVWLGFRVERTLLTP
ncbi:MAG: SUMF1/EgtB/PvdO family nonheme iron enzyme [Hyphomicrobiales bacterium]